MSKPVWDITQPSNTNLGTFVERKTLGSGSTPIINLLVAQPGSSDPVSISLISGKLPGGLRLEGSTIIGTPYSVIGTVTSKFVLRAQNIYVDQNNQTRIGISDRTFTITIISENESIVWGTQQGLLPVGPNKHYYICVPDQFFGPDLHF